MGKLTKTELAVGDLYYRQGLKPREIAQRLGISINTVYKALSKYRAYSRDNVSVVEKPQESTEPSNNNMQQPLGVASINLSFTVSINQPPSASYLELNNVGETLNSLMREIKLIKDDYAQLINAIMDLKKLITSINTLSCSNGYDKPNDGQRDLNLPSFVKDNVWVDIIRSKEGGRSMFISAKGS
ncbi:helix-turn-helix domain-containing protein [Caldivirga maquilingensis]|uniref:Bacterio-opsin activator, HTH domain protein n=1 Tax=Caldivirga maquilingensis (strain ATCC 700844 / DSM 13496 / JCM 10307 / IC-167) TaxID=397948 RepID=A8M9Y7_CALMQ|nr:helix-turn-helix domain-containing protein [Caldivirga maquilingensis]ABW02458.1 bacterio-opsin activator, HTH domain protein [Caldivirga maquilingensis IC-167]